MSVKVRVVFAVAGAWLLIALVWGSQTALGAAVQGHPIPFGGALRSALVQTVPWIPVTLAIIALAVRFPVTRTTWPRHVPLHLVASVVLTFFDNVLVVLGYWITAGHYQSVGTLLR